MIDSRQTPFGLLQVFEVEGTRFLGYGTSMAGRPEVFQSALNLQWPHLLPAPYARLMMLGLIYSTPSARVLQIGAGAGVMSSYLIRTYPQVQVSAIDVDGEAFELGRRHFGLMTDPRLRLLVGDGRSWLASAHASFDVCMLDAYDNRSIPTPLQEREFFATVAERLAPGGVVVQNVYLRQIERNPLQATMATVFEQIDAYGVGDNVVLIGYQGAARPLAELRDSALSLDAATEPAHALEAQLAFRLDSASGGFDPPDVSAGSKF